MNPVIYFDLFDKVMEHTKDEIIHLLTHLTDPSQNSLPEDLTIFQVFKLIYQKYYLYSLQIIYTRQIEF